MKTTAACLTVSLCLLAGCGGGDDSSDSAISGGADPDAAKVIDDWSKTLTDGDVEGAADYFELPSVVQNGTPPVSLKTREDVIAFNESLPCGAELVEAEDHAGFVIATFKLTERRGAGECGAGVGEEAQTAFKIEDGHITEWRRVPSDAAQSEPQGPLI
jgi:limonene-1,2-epoxide hydrolase